MPGKPLWQDCSRSHQFKPVAACIDEHQPVVGLVSMRHQNVDVTLTHQSTQAGCQLRTQCHCQLRANRRGRFDQ